MQARIGAPAFDENSSTADLRSNAMTHRVFHQRLKQHYWYERVEGVRRNGEPHTQALAQPDLFDFQVLFRKTDFLGKRYRCGRLRVEGSPQEVADLRQHAT